jgi:hypothetical protein
MEEFELVSKKNIEKAKKIIDELEIIELCKEYDCKANLIGSVATGLLMSNLDIDFHIYPKIFNINKIYELIGKIAEKDEITRTSCYNFLNGNDKTLDWHIHYMNENKEDWRIDMIFIRYDSKYIEKAEKIVQEIKNNMTEMQKRNILFLKWEGYKRQIEYKGIEIYKAVIEYGIETIEEFIEWKSCNKEIDLWEIKV